MPRSIFTIGALPGISIEGAYIHPENIEKVRKLIEAMPNLKKQLLKEIINSNLNLNLLRFYIDKKK